VERGYVTTRVLAGDQDLKSRELLLTVVPGLVRQVRFEDPAIPAEQLDNTVPLNSGDLLNLRAIEQGLENLKRVPTAEADIQIVPAEGADAAAGESDLVVKWRQLRRWRVSLSADDAGNRSTGKNQGTATFSVDNPFGMSDLFYVSYNHALAPANSDGRKTDGYNLHYSVPIGFWLLSSNYSTSEYYQTVAGATEPYVYSGESQNIEVKLNRMLWRNASNKLQASVRGWQRMSSSFINDTEILVQQRRTAGWGAGINERTYFGRSSLDTSLDYTHGTGMFGALSAPEETTGEGTNEMEIVGLNIQLDAPFEIAGLPLRYSGSWRQQWNRTPLTSQDRFSIGNRYTVRGFDGELTLMGERGFVSRNEIATAVQALGAETYVALDYGRVGGLPVASELGRSLLGTALGLRGGLRGFSYDFFVGTPLEKPKHFETARITTGFSLAWSY
jgi:hemolysin activation/secretion protein